MSTFQENIAKYYNWNIDYTNQVIYEYEKFIYLKSKYNDIIPSIDIDKLWKYHIFSVNEYYNYCMQNCGKIINYDPFEEINIQKISNTINSYKNIFGDILYKNIWIFDVKVNIDEIGILSNIYSTLPNNNLILQNNNPIYPSYIENKPDMLSLKLYFIYKNNKNTDPRYDKQLISYKPSNINETVNTIIDMVSSQLNISKDNIILKLHPEINLAGYDKISYLNNGNLRETLSLSNLINKSYNFIIVEMNNENLYKYSIV
jgi:hypothetical protein